MKFFDSEMTIAVAVVWLLAALIVPICESEGALQGMRGESVPLF